MFPSLIPFLKLTALSVFHRRFLSNKSHLYPQLTVRKITFCSSWRKWQWSRDGVELQEEELRVRAGRPSSTHSWAARKPNQTTASPSSVGLHRGLLPLGKGLEKIPTLLKAKISCVTCQFCLGVKGSDDRRRQPNKNPTGVPLCWARRPPSFACPGSFFPAPTWGHLGTTAVHMDCLQPAASGSLRFSAAHIWSLLLPSEAAWWPILGNMRLAVHS